MPMPMEKLLLKVTEIYCTILGESSFSGQLCSIIRLTGCHRRCRWCDSEFAFEGGSDMTIKEIVETIKGNGSSTVLVTGGEPLMQESVIDLLNSLIEKRFTVLLETSGTTGTIPLSNIPESVIKIIDIKTPGSGIDQTDIDWDGIQLVSKTDELKFVISDREDYQWSRELVLSNRIPKMPNVIFSPVQDELTIRELADWVIEDKLNVRVLPQLHKVIWPEKERGV